MAAVREIPPLMILSEETKDRMVFRFRGKRWGVVTLIPGVVLVPMAIGLRVVKHSSPTFLAILGIFGGILIYSGIYSLKSDQWLVADQNTKSIRFHKSNLYGTVDWERKRNEFKEIRVFKNLGKKNSTIALICSDDSSIYIGENEFGAFNCDKALALTNKVGSRTGINVVTMK